MTNPSPDPGETARYELRVAGHLGDRRSAWFDGLRVRREPEGTTVIEAPGLDQAALHGLLRQVRDAGLHLLSVTRTDHRPR